MRICLTAAVGDDSGPCPAGSSVVSLSGRGGHAGPEAAMDQVLVRTCSAAEAAVLVRSAGRCARVGSTRLCVRQPTAANSIDPEQMARYVVSVEVLDSSSDPGPSASDDAAR